MNDRVIFSLDNFTVQEIWKLYAHSFESTDEYCAQDQICYDEQSLSAALVDDDYQKFLLMADDQIIGLCLMTSNLTKARIAYCNDRFLRHKYPKYAAEGRLYYVTCICVSPEMQKKGHGLELLKAVCQFINDHQAMVAYDFSENKNPGLTGLITFVGSQMNWNTIEIPLDAQHYTSLYYEHNGIPG